MELYAGLTRGELNVTAASLERKMSPLYHHGRSWIVTRSPMAFVASWGKYQEHKPGTSLTDYFVLQMRGNVSTDWAPFYKLIRQAQIDLDDWFARHPDPPSRKKTLAFLRGHIPKVFGTVAKKIKQDQDKRGRAKARFDGGYVNFDAV